MAVVIQLPLCDHYPPGQYNDPVYDHTLPIITECQEGVPYWGDNYGYILNETIEYVERLLLYQKFYYAFCGCSLIDPVTQVPSGYALFEPINVPESLITPPCEIDEQQIYADGWEYYGSAVRDEQVSPFAPDALIHHVLSTNSSVAELPAPQYLGYAPSYSASGVSMDITIPFYERPYLGVEYNLPAPFEGTFMLPGDGQVNEHWWLSLVVVLTYHYKAVSKFQDYVPGEEIPFIFPPLPLLLLPILPLFPLPGSECMTHLMGVLSGGTGLGTLKRRS